MPLTIRLPQKGGVGMSLSAATSERVVSVVSAPSTFGEDPARTRRLRSSGSASPRSIEGSFLALAMMSMSRSPSKASRA